jgi:hypothetical protein
MRSNALAALRSWNSVAGGHGGTGTALACLAILSGTPPNDAVEWVRANYCEKAVETDEQRRLVTDFSA